ncbi:hypothetical protein [Nonomuraea bangladeshensis]|uniref:hypothetical protein n=1 Tax=Nonomuraea bangladeshensis TaxID=404385 RepID=UPI003C30BBDD
MQDAHLFAQQLAAMPLQKAVEVLNKTDTADAALLLALMRRDAALDRLAIMQPARAGAILSEMDESLAAFLLVALSGKGDVSQTTASIPPTRLAQIMVRTEQAQAEFLLNVMGPLRAAAVLAALGPAQAAALLVPFCYRSRADTEGPIADITDAFFGFPPAASGSIAQLQNAARILLAMDAGRAVSVLCASPPRYAAELVNAAAPHILLPVLTAMAPETLAAILMVTRWNLVRGYSLAVIDAPRAAEIIGVLNPDRGCSVLMAMPPGWQAPILRHLQAYPAARILLHMRPDVRESILGTGNARWARDIRRFIAEMSAQG